MASVKQNYPKLCDGLGLLQWLYTIKLRLSAKVVSLKSATLCPTVFDGESEGGTPAHGAARGYQPDRAADRVVL